MDFANSIQLLMGLVMTGISFWIKTQREDIKQLQQHLQKTREEYVHKDDLKELKSELNHRFDKLEDLIQKRNS